MWPGVCGLEAISMPLGIDSFLGEQYKHGVLSRRALRITDRVRHLAHEREMRLANVRRGKDGVEGNILVAGKVGGDLS